MVSKSTLFLRRRHEDCDRAGKSPNTFATVITKSLVLVGLCVLFELFSSRAYSVDPTDFQDISIQDEQNMPQQENYENQELQRLSASPKFKLASQLRYYEVGKLEWDMNERPPMTTAYQDATVIHKASWFQPKKICNPTCCAETVAISLHQDDTRIKNTVDGIDLADIIVRGHHWPSHLSFHATVLSDELIPCLQPGTIIHADSYEGVVDRFFKSYRPKLQEPYLLITSETDSNSPMEDYISKLTDDPLLVHWYGNNPNFPTDSLSTHQQKFTGFPLGLSKYHVQMPHLTHYMRARNFTNPFTAKNKKHWTESIELFDPATNDTTNVLFVKFGIHEHAEHRKEPFDMACQGRTSKARDPITCNQDSFSIHETYFAASKYLFGLSPDGNGADCYRNYELWMLGVIPIVQYHDSHDEMLQDLPIIQVKNWNHTQEDLLQMMRDYVRSDEFLNTNFDAGWERLFLRYWRRKVLADTGRDKDIVTDENGVQYYQAWKYTLYQEPIIAN